MSATSWLWYYGRSGEKYHVDIPVELEAKLLSLEGKIYNRLCLEKGPEAVCAFTCFLPANHGGKFHLSIGEKEGKDELCAIWRS